jgi:uncharacterized membrane protein
MKVYIKFMYLFVFIILFCTPSQAAFFIDLRRNDCGSLDNNDCHLTLKALSPDGSVVVGVFWDNGTYKTMKWTKKGGWQPLFGISDSPVTIAGASADGSTLVGQYDDGSNNGIAFLWTADGEIIEMWEGEAYDVSHDGSVVSGAGWDQESLWGSFAARWTRKDGVVNLGGAPGERIDVAEAVSGDGSTIVGLNTSQAFRWTQKDGMVRIATSEPYSHAFDVSTDGSVIVGTMGGNYVYTEAFIWTKSNGAVGLGFLSEDDEISCAYGVSGDGSMIVGHSEYEAFIWDQTNGMRKLSDVLVNTYGLDLAGRKLVIEKTMAISADGKTIIGDDWIANIAEDCPSFEAGPDACTSECPCGEGEGDCDSDADCDAGLICVNNVGANYGWPESRDVCEVP